MMNILKTFGPQTADADTVRALDIEELELASGGFDLSAPDPTNPLCPEPHLHLRPSPGNKKA